MSILGGLVGITLAVFLILTQKVFGLILITPTLPYPVSLKLMDVLLVFITISILGLLASKIAVTRISKPLLNH